MSSDVTFDFTGKVAVITGATGGIGRATSLAFARAGADLTLADIPGSPLAELAEEIRTLGRRAEVVVVDVRDEAQVQQMADRTLAVYGHVDVLVNTAGVICRRPALDMTLEEWNWVVDVSLQGAWLCCKKIGAIMVRQGSGSIINFASDAGTRGRVAYSAYGPAKAGIINLTKGLAVEWGPHGVRVNSFGPGFLNTKINKEILDDPAWLSAFASMPMGSKVLEPEDMTSAIMFLGSDAARWITGIFLSVDGGRGAL